MEKPPDVLEKGIRFGCGAILGAVLGLSLAAKNSGDGWEMVWLVLAVLAFGCGWLATRYGDAFWERISKWLWFWQ